jgi:uncharacterized membrane protein
LDLTTPGPTQHALEPLQTTWTTTLQFAPFVVVQRLLTGSQNLINEALIVTASRQCFNSMPTPIKEFVFSIIQRVKLNIEQWYLYIYLMKILVTTMFFSLLIGQKQ